MPLPTLRWPSSLYDSHIIVRDEKAQGTAGGTLTTGAWRTRDLNTELVDTHNLVSIASNQMTLQAGTYYARISAPAYNVGEHKIKLYNVTAAADILLGSSEYCSALGGSTDKPVTRSYIIGRFTLNVASVIEVQHVSSLTQATNGFGIATGSGVEVYTIVELWRVKDSGVITALGAYICIQDQKAQNTDGGTFTSGADRTRDLNTEVADTHNLASVASNQITIAPGTYRCLIFAPAYAVVRHRAWLYNVTGSAILRLGTVSLSPTANADMTLSVIQGRFTLAVQSILEVRHRCETTSTTVGFGVASNFAGVEVYTSCEFWKEA